MSNGKVMIVRLIVGLIKKILLYKMSFFLEPCSRNKNKVKVELDLSNYATKCHQYIINTSQLAKKIDLA